MAKRLTDGQLNSFKPPNIRTVLFEDGGRGFGIRIEPSGRKSFFLEYRFGEGKERRNRMLTIGQYPRVSLTNARSIARQSLAQIEQVSTPPLKSKLKKLLIEIPLQWEIWLKSMLKNGQRLKKRALVERR